MKKTKKFVKPGTIASYLRAQRKLRRSQAHGNVLHTRDHALEEAPQTNHDQEHEVQMEQEMSIGLEQQGLDQQEINQNSTMQIRVPPPTIATVANEDAITSSAGPSTLKKRGQTAMKAVHARSEENRKAIFLNELNQPIGPDDKTLSEFSSFLGTLARNSTLAPITVTNWRKMPTKESLWEYVQKKYIVPQEGKKWVLATIGDDWRVYKCRVKKEHYYKYNTDKMRILNRPQHIGEEKFKELLNYWNSTNAKRITEVNINNRKRQINMHTAGKKSFARIRKQMQDANENNEVPSNTALFIETRKRQPNKTYKESFDDTSEKISQMQVVQSQQSSENQSVDAFSMVMGGTRPGRAMLYGRCVTPTDLKGKGVSDGSSIKISQNFIEGMKEQMREEMREEIREEMKKQMEEQMATYKSSLQSSMQQQFVSMMSQLQGLVPAMNINQVPAFNLNFGSPEDANSAQQTQAIRARNVSSASSYEPQGQ
ncbi:putative transposase Ptta/En/Spm plant protein [Dioscorea alata]|uniref:Transposase Ptta/En/Spm plant protein n=1 Tax=Dioscorea alata TaxID=55571 RepID=A0ACB7U1V1_DIOAL|nr:putative transposase Ptta/En/Spm plant protein [Dioscorea alata]